MTRAAHINPTKGTNQMKTITTTLTPITFFLPADVLRAAFQCVGTEQTRYYLDGVLIEADKLVAPNAPAPHTPTQPKEPTK